IELSKLDAENNATIQYPPSSWSMRILNAQLAKKKIKLIFSQSFSQNVSWLHRCMHIFHLNGSISYLVTNKMTIHFDMLRTLMINWVSCHVQSRLTVTIQMHRTIVLNSKKTQ